MKRLSLLCVLLAACSTVAVVDTSPDAIKSGDYSLIHSVCGAAPGRGLDVCLVSDGTPIDSVWRLVVPSGKSVIAGELDVYYRDIHKSYPISGSVVEIPWKDFFGVDLWSADFDGEVMALLVVRWKDATGIEQVTKFRGLAKIIVTSKGYERLPIDSGVAQWQTTCKIDYTTAGRSALSCK